MRVERENCTGCGYCLLSCPEDAISSDGWATVDEDRCNDCNACSIADTCPSRAIRRVPARTPYLLKASH